MAAGDSPDKGEAKRWKTRKGTHSCWECKRRKIRCIFASPGDAVCVSCSRRCTDCVSQEFPDQTTPQRRSRLIGDRFVRVEAMIEQLAKQPVVEPRQSRPRSRSDTNTSDQGDLLTPAASNAPSTAASVHVPSGAESGPAEESLAIPGFFVYEDKFNTPAASLPDAAHPQVIITAAPTSSSDRLHDISRALLAAYPNEAYLDALVRASDTFLNMYQSMFHCHGELDEWFDLPDHERLDYHLLHNRYAPETHPVVIAEQMLIFANVLQNAASDTLAELKAISNEPPRAVMARLVTAATSLVTGNDKMLDTSEGMTCLILDSMYQANEGNLRLAWLAHRRIVSLAQATGIHRRPYRALHIKSAQSNCILDPRFLWYRLLYVDRFLSLMLGLPACSLDASMMLEPAFSQETPMGRLERRHAFAAGRILERNERDPSADDFALTQSIDMDLQKAASAMPGKWWLVPGSTALHNKKERFWESRRLINQTYHFYLLHQLHLPYMLFSSSSSTDQGKYDYSRNTCASASRDILIRCLITHKQGSLWLYSHTLNFLALTASLTLLLMHLYIKRHVVAPCFLAHQRLSDRAMIEQVLEAMEKDTLVDNSESRSPDARMLRQLLMMDDGVDMTPENDSSNGASAGTANSIASDPIRLFVPFFGAINISRGGIITTEAMTPEGATNNSPQSEGQVGDNTKGVGNARQEKGEVSISMQPTDNFLSSSLLNPLPTADTNQWALQGVDFAFFDSLMRGISGPMGDNVSGVPWPDVSEI